MYANIFTTIIALGTVAAAIAAFLTARQTKSAVEATQLAAKATERTAEAAIVHSFLSKYFLPEMASYLRLLHEWKNKNSERFASSWIDKRSSNDAEAKKVDDARRFVKSYFDTATKLYVSEFISLDCYKTICQVAGNITYYDIIDRLELALNPGRDPSTIDTMKQYIGRYEAATAIRSVPP
jgi:hypothetical protein